MKAAFLALLLTGCASLPPGITMSDDESKACKASGCSVWTDEELKALGQVIFRKGYEAGRKSI